jgi:flagellar hook protein FlgE
MMRSVRRHLWPENHQTMMDVVGNNIASVNTTGFKRPVTFQDILSQTVAGKWPEQPAAVA